MKGRFCVTFWIFLVFFVRLKDHSSHEVTFGRQNLTGSPLGSVKWGELGLAGRVGTKFRTFKTENRLHGRVFGGVQGVFDASPECFRKAKSLLMQVSLCFLGSKLCPNSPRQSRLTPLYGFFLKKQRNIRVFFWKPPWKTILLSPFNYNFFFKKKNIFEA